MISVLLRMVNDGGSDVFDNPVLMPAIPPIGGHVRIIDRHSNYRRLEVEDVVIGAVRRSLMEETPNLAMGEAVIRVYGREVSDSGGL